MTFCYHNTYAIGLCVVSIIFKMAFNSNIIQYTYETRVIRNKGLSQITVYLRFVLMSSLTIVPISL